MTDYRTLLLKVLRNLPYEKGENYEFARIGIDGLSDEEMAALEELIALHLEPRS